MSKKDEKDAKGKSEAKPKGDKPKADKPKAAAPAKPKADAKPKGKGKDKDAADEAAPKAAPKAEEKAPPPRLREKYRAEITAALMKRFAYKNVMQVPRLQKIIVNMGLGAAVQNPKLIDTAVTEMASIAGQKPVVTKAKKSIANFKIRQGMPIGVMVTLRRERMWEFLDRLVSVSLPRVRDFRGISPRAFDGAGNYTLGLKEQIVFPEINFDKVEHTHGMNVTFVTSAKSNEEAKELLGMLGMPFRS